jgi:hypothetical protein
MVVSTAKLCTDADADSSSHQTIMLRKEAVSEWLEDVVQQKVRQETAALLDEPGTQDKEHHISTVFSLLSGRKILEACQKTQDCGKVTEFQINGE